MKIFYILISMCILLSLTACGGQVGPKTQGDHEGHENGEHESHEHGENDIHNNNENMPKEEITGSVVLDTNHALAGKVLNFDVEIVEIKKSGSGAENIVENTDSIEVHYTGTLENGEKFDSSLDRGETLGFTVGAGQMIPGFDAGVVGMEKGESKTLVLEPKDAYGEYDASRTQTVPKSQLESFINAGFKLEVGEELPTQVGSLKIIEVIEE